MATLAVEDGTLWYDNHGEGRPLVFLHGAWMSADAWEPQVERFGDEYRVIRLDLRGHGRSGTTDRRRYSVDLFVDDLEALLDHLDVEDPIICGLSLGNLITQAYLDRHPTDPAAAVDRWCDLLPEGGRIALLNATPSDHPAARPLNLAFRGFVRAGAPGKRLAHDSPARDLERKVREARVALEARCGDVRRTSLVGGYLTLASGRIVG